MFFSAKGCEKAAEFVSFCDAFEIPVLTLTNVKGYKACKCSEKRLAKALAHLTSAFAGVYVSEGEPDHGRGIRYRLCCYEFQLSLGADFVYAWPDAKVGMMDADLAVKIMYADASADELAEKAKEYDALQGSVMTAARRRLCGSDR